MSDSQPLLRARSVCFSAGRTPILTGVDLDPVSYTHLTLPTIYSV